MLDRRLGEPSGAVTIFLTILILSVLGAGIPTLFYVGIAWSLDRYEHEPWWLLLFTFLWGSVPAVILALILEVVFSLPLSALAPGGGAALINVAVIAPLVEEPFKCVPLLAIFFLYRREFDGLMDGLLYGALVGFGFAMTENVLYSLNAWSNGGLGALASTIFLRSFVFGMMHALWSSMFGLGLGIARYARSPWLARTAPLCGLATGMLLHGLHNYFASQGGGGVMISFLSYALGCATWLILVYAASLREAAWIFEELEEEVRQGVLPARLALASGNHRVRFRTRMAALRETGSGRARRLSHLYALASELAFKKRQQELDRGAIDHAQEIARLRDELRKLSAEVA